MRGERSTSGNRASRRSASHVTKRLARLVTIAAALLLLAGSTASASDYAIGSDAKSITVDQAIHPGQTVKLPVFGIYNKGTKQASYEMAVVAVGKADAVDSSWVDFSPRTFSLDPGAVTKVTVTVFVPSGARPGTYQALLAGSIVGTGGSNVNMSVGIGPMLTIRVAQGWWLSAGWYAFAGFFERSAPWSYFGAIVACLAIVSGVLALLSRRSARRARHSRRSLRATAGSAASPGEGDEGVPGSA